MWFSVVELTSDQGRTAANVFQGETAITVDDKGRVAIPTAFRDLSRFERLGFGGLPVLVAKTHLSVTADPADRTLAATSGWVLPVREVRLAAGAGYVYALTGEITTMPGLGSHPGAEAMDLTDCGEIVGLS